MGKVSIANFDLFRICKLKDPCWRGPRKTLVNWPDLAPVSKAVKIPEALHTWSSPSRRPQVLLLLRVWSILRILLSFFSPISWPGFGSDAIVQGPLRMGARAFPVIRDGPTHNSLLACCTPYRKFLPSCRLAAAFRHSSRVSARATAALALARNTTTV